MEALFEYFDPQALVQEPIVVGKTVVHPVQRLVVVGEGFTKLGGPARGHNNI